MSHGSSPRTSSVTLTSTPDNSQSGSRCSEQADIPRLTLVELPLAESTAYESPELSPASCVDIYAWVCACLSSYLTAVLVNSGSRLSIRRRAETSAASSSTTDEYSYC